MGPTAVDHQAQGGPREQTGRDLEHSSSTCQSGGKGQTAALGDLQKAPQLLGSPRQGPFCPGQYQVKPPWSLVIRRQQHTFTNK